MNKLGKLFNQSREGGPGSCYSIAECSIQVAAKAASLPLNGEKRIAVMMGSRGTRGGDEIDALSSRSRRLLRWRPGVLRTIKRRFWKRTRAQVRDRNPSELA